MFVEGVGSRQRSPSGHPGRPHHGVRACAVTPDGRCVVSASDDKTLKVWDLENFACLLTHRGDVAYTAIATGPTAIVGGDGRSGIWILD